MTRTRASTLRPGPIRLTLALAAIGLTWAALASPVAANAQPLETGISGMGEMSPEAFQEVGASGSRFVRITVPWEYIAPNNRPSGWQAENPADPHYEWASIDREVRETVNAGFTPLMLVEGAPKWAQRCTSPSRIQFVEVCDPSPVALGEFATAAARRYSGSFGDLPAVRYWQGLNEPNLTLFFYPQFSVSGKPLAANLYRPLINSFYAAIKAVNPSNLVLAGGLGPIARPGSTVGPMQFARELLCMTGGSHPRPLKGECEGGVHFDIFDIHPYTTGAPTHKGGPDDVELGDMKKLQRLIVAADRAGHIQGSDKQTEIWVAEFSWDSKPPDPGGLQMKIETRWVAEALHVSWLAGVSNFFWYSLRDAPPEPNLPFSQTLQSGLYFRGQTIKADRPKPVLRAFRFPFVAYPGKKGLSYWGRTPTSRSGRIVIQVSQDGKWRKLATARANRYGIFQGLVHNGYGGDKKGAARALFSGARSAAFSMRPVPDFHQPPFG